MTTPEHLHISDYTYQLPEEKIARFPLEQRDQAKLLIYQHGALSEDRYENIAGHLPENSLMVFNETKVVHARLLFRKPTGGVIEIFCLEPAEQMDMQTAMQQKGSVLWQCMIGGASKWKHGQVLHMQVTQPPFEVTAAIVDKRNENYIVKLTWRNDCTFAELLHHAGRVPLPPYLHRDATTADEVAYQTIYAKNEGSVAAPTAGLHFTDRVMDSLSAKHIQSLFVTLHVGAGTFKPVKSDALGGHEMHAEWIDVSRDTIARLHQHAHKVVAVGTTSLRTLETLYWIGNNIASGRKMDLADLAVKQWEPYQSHNFVDKETALAAVMGYMRDNRLERLITRTQLLIAPGYTFKMVDGLVTNFHQPGSTLLLLIAAFTANWRRIYDYALQHDYRFLSYGDGSLLWRDEG
jgi:S-adenosylmethionine:tRNA ribosyltransferase-isomerase